MPILLFYRNKPLTIIIGFVFSLFLYQIIISFVNNNIEQSLPLILLYTFNHSVKTRENICRGTRNGGHIVNFDSCSHKCEFSCRMEDFKKRSTLAVLFFGEDFYWPFKLTDQNRSSFDQRWIFWSWEAPINHPEYTRSGLTFNWTMTYRQDSDIVHNYGRYVLRNQSKSINDHQSIDFYLSPIDNRSTFDVKKEFVSRQNRILWIVSNCKSRSKRKQLAQELSQHFPIDEYGKCLHSTRSRNQLKSNDFESILFRYKFYLAFENAQCQDYITEKAFYNALAHGSIPIVFGPNENNYKQILPPNSFIHIEHFTNITQLVNELDQISKHLKTFTIYHRWRTNYRLISWPSNYFIDDCFCDLCIRLHSNNSERKSYSNFSKWLNRCL